MKILAIHRYFWPDVAPYASILRAIGSSLASQGHDVQVLAGRPGYRGLNFARVPAREMVDGIELTRVRLLPERRFASIVRIVNAFMMAIRVFFAVLWRKPGVVIASTAPPFFLAGAAALASRISGARFIYHCMDIHPEIGQIQGHFNVPGLGRALRWLDGAICKSADRVIVLSSAMRDAMIRNRPGLNPKSVIVLNNPALPVFEPEESAPELPEEFETFQGRKILFAGNLGRFQSLGPLLDAFRQEAGNSDAGLFFAGSGSMETDLKEASGEFLGRKIFFLGQLSPAVVNDMLLRCSAGVVSVKTGVDDYAFPSKLTNYIANRCPVLCIASRGSALETFVRDNDIGWVADGADVESIRNALVEISEEGDSRRLKDHVQAVYQEEYSLKKYLGKWNQVING